MRRSRRNGHAEPNSVLLEVGRIAGRAVWLPTFCHNHLGHGRSGVLDGRAAHIHSGGVADINRLAVARYRQLGEVDVPEIVESDKDFARFATRKRRHGNDEIVSSKHATGRLVGDCGVGQFLPIFLDKLLLLEIKNGFYIARD